MAKKRKRKYSRGAGTEVNLEPACQRRGNFLRYGPEHGRF